MVRADSHPLNAGFGMLLCRGCPPHVALPRTDPGGRPTLSTGLAGRTRRGIRRGLVEAHLDVLGGAPLLPLGGASERTAVLLQQRGVAEASRPQPTPFVDVLLPVP